MTLWKGLPFPTPGELPNRGIEPTSHVSCIGRRILHHYRHLGSPHSLPPMPIWHLSSVPFLLLPSSLLLKNTFNRKSASLSHMTPNSLGGENRGKALLPWENKKPLAINTQPGVGCHVLLQGISPTKGLNCNLLCLLHWQEDFLPLSYLGSPIN